MRHPSQRTCFGIALGIAQMSCLLLFPAVASAQTKATPSNVATFEEIAQAFSVALKKAHMKRVLIGDFTDPDGKVTPFGVWLADRLASANTWGPIVVVGRKKAQTELDALPRVDPQETNINAYDNQYEMTRQFSKSLQAALISGSYTAAENGLGVTLKSVSFGKFTSVSRSVIRAKIESTQELKSKLTKPLESLVPSNGLYTEDMGGVSECECDRYPIGPGNPEQYYGTEPAVIYSFTINADGHISDISPCTYVGRRVSWATEYCPEVVALPITQKWVCNPAQDIDGKSVPVRRREVEPDWFTDLYMTTARTPP